MVLFPFPHSLLAVYWPSKPTLVPSVLKVNWALGKNGLLETGGMAARGGTLMGGKKAAKCRLQKTGRTTAAGGEGQEQQQGQSESIEGREEVEERLDV